ncbi:MAG: hypothetical protein MUF54_24095 [Polyangiaceae bacterium]|nr:hypothetical protein [Polyangiaceae bacterium]
MAGNQTLEDGLSILRAIARSDAFKQMRARFRAGAERIADNDKMPRVVAGSAGIVAALLTDPERQTGEPEQADPDVRGLDLAEVQAAVQHDNPDADDAAGQAFAAVRDLGDEHVLAEGLAENDDEGEVESSDTDDRLFTFHPGDDQLEEPVAAATRKSSARPPPTKRPSAAKQKAPVRKMAEPSEGHGRPQVGPAPKKRSNARANASKVAGHNSSTAPPMPEAPRPKAPRATKTPRPPRGGRSS